MAADFFAIVGKSQQKKGPRLVSSAELDSIFRILVRVGRVPEMDEAGAEVEAANFMMKNSRSQVGNYPPEFRAWSSI